VDVCVKCGSSLAKINGRTLKSAILLTKASFQKNKFSDTDWVSVCPLCDSDVLGAETNHPWPFQSSDGVMRVVDDYYKDHKIQKNKAYDFLGFEFSELAMLSALRLFEIEYESTKLIELQGESLSSISSFDDFLRFSESVCIWGGGKRVWANLLRHHGPEKLSHMLKSWLVDARSSLVDEEAIAMGTHIKGLGVSFASKHLRMLKPERFAVLDDVLQQGLGIALNPRGYRLFMSELRSFRDRHQLQIKVANLEAALFLLVRQGVRAKVATSNY